ncbi:MAG: Pantoate--beta-alanine ligase, partial [uncultured Thermoleophilia bacterium]
EDRPHHPRDARRPALPPRAGTPDRSRADHGRLPRGPPQPHAGRAPGVRPRRRLAVREPHAVRRRRGSGALPAGRAGRRPPGRRARRRHPVRARRRGDVPARLRDHGRPRARRRRPRRRRAPRPLRGCRHRGHAPLRHRRARRVVLRPEGLPTGGRDPTARRRSGPAGRDPGAADRPRARRPGLQLAQPAADRRGARARALAPAGPGRRGGA